jgi:hypothetical protein
MFGTPFTNSTAFRDGNVPLNPLSPSWGIIANNHIWVMLKNKYWTRTTPWIKAELEISPLADFHTTPAMSTVACAEPQNSKHSPGFQREMLRKGKGCNFLRSILNGTAWNGTSSASSTSTKSQNRLKSIIACVAGHILVRKSLQPLALFEPKKNYRLKPSVPTPRQSTRRSSAATHTPLPLCHFFLMLCWLAIS